jgi:hypothetical protein
MFGSIDELRVSIHPFFQIQAPMYYETNHQIFLNVIMNSMPWDTFVVGTAVAQCLSCCATNRKVAGSIPAGVIGFFIDIKSLWSHYGPGVDSASKINEYQEYFLGVKVVGA